MLPSLNFRVQSWNLAGNNPSTWGVEAGGSNVLERDPVSRKFLPSLPGLVVESTLREKDLLCLTALDGGENCLAMSPGSPGNL